MAKYSDAGRPRNEALQEQRIAQKQKELARIDRMRAEMAKQVEREIEILNKMREQHTDFTQSVSIEPQQSSAAPTGFQSQYDQFGTPSNERLKTIGNEGVLQPGIPGLSSAGIAGGERLSADAGDRKIIGHTGHLSTPRDDTPFYRTSDRDEHWTRLSADPGKAVYISGYYLSSGRDSKQYEYILGSTQIPISVGDMISVPVHHSGHNDGKFMAGHDRRFIVTDIYSKAKFHPYHDVAW